MSTNFEILTLKGGVWQLDTTMKSRDDAIEHAKELFGERRYEGVKVVKDVMDHKSGQSRETVIYDSTKNRAPAGKPKPEAAPEPLKSGQKAPKADVDFKKRAPKAPQKKGGGDAWFVIKIGFFLILILGVAAFLVGGLEILTELLADIGILI